MSIVVAQLGARMHYAVPRLLHREHLLEHLYTDICASKGWPRVLGALPRALRPARLQRLATRVPKGIPPARITAFTSFGFEYAQRVARARDAAERDTAFLWSGSEFCRRVIARGFGHASAVYVFNSAGLEILYEARRRGLKGIVEQTIAPRAIERRLLRDEATRFPEWETSGSEPVQVDEFCAREAAEWAAADIIVCGSDHVKEGVVACGGEKSRCVVVPYGIDHGPLAPAKKQRAPGPLRVLTVGAIGLRKGSPYVLAAAEKLGTRAEFRMVGAVNILPEAERRLRQSVHVTGIVPRSEMAEQFAWADVFLLPSLCEGSATSTYEAMANGLPVICTPQTGSVVRDGVDGFIIPMRDAGAIVEKLMAMADDPALVAAMSSGAREHSASYTLEKYSERLIAAFRDHNLIP
jgi:glycosyltransferase involved in cell wall biosynthesis